MAKRSPKGAGTVRQRKDGRWEGRLTVGRDPGTGRQIQQSFYGVSQIEVVKKMQQISTEIESGSYLEPSKITVGEWLDLWLEEYCGNIKPSTKASYRGHIRNHIKPGLGAIKLQKLKGPQVQKFYNSLSSKKLSAKTIGNIHGALHSALTKAVKCEYIKSNPTDTCDLPTKEKKEMNVLCDSEIKTFIQAIEGHMYETVYFVALFTGMRQGELLGLTWDCIDFEHGAITIGKQLTKNKLTSEFYLDTPKNGKSRVIYPAAIVMNKLREHKNSQTEQRLKVGPVWDNPDNLVFTNEAGRHLIHYTVFKHFKAIVTAMERPELRFHDLRHSYATMALQLEDNIKNVQETLGHYTASFTLDIYGHVTTSMKQRSSQKMNDHLVNALELQQA